jgi:hypothetical protein
MVCEGTQTPRCAWFNWDDTNDRIRGYAYMEDSPAYTQNYDVALNNFAVRRWNGSQWLSVMSDTDYDGWHSFSDSVQSGLRDCDNRYYHVVVTANWQGASSGSDVLISGNYLC